jgi:hypothetical protein
MTTLPKDWWEKTHKLFLDENIGVYVVATGAGAGIQQLLWTQPGASAYLLGGAFPYATQDLNRFLGFVPMKYCCEDTAVDMATEAYIRARTISLEQGINRPVYGLAVTASVASTKKHRGDHRFYVAVVGPDYMRVEKHTVYKGVGVLQRVQDGREADETAIAALRFAVGKKDPTQDRVFTDRLNVYPVFYPHGKRVATDWLNARVDGYLPGAFNPPHEGHYIMANEFKGRVAFMVERRMPHKDSLTFQQVLDRVAMFRAQGMTDKPLIVTDGVPLYSDKALAFKGKKFLIGADTYCRIVEKNEDGTLRWGSLEGEDELFSHFGALGTEFIVYPRANFEMPPTAVFRSGICVFHHAQVHPGDHSSTAIRASLQA